MSANAYILEAETRHQIYLQRLGGSEAKRVKREVDNLIKRIIAMVATTPDGVARQTALIQELRLISQSAYQQIIDSIDASMLNLADYELEFQQKLLGGAITASLTVPSTAQVVNAVQFRLIEVKPGYQMTMREALRQYTQSEVDSLTQIVRDGFATGTPNREISRAIQDNLPIRRNHADAVARTATNAAASGAREELYAGNADIIDGLKYVATLDSRTRIDHAAKDGNVYALNDPNRPKTPDGWNCRCVLVPVIKPEYQLKGLQGVRPSKGDETTQVSSRMTYNGFLKQQSKEFQDEVLGVQRAKLWRSGKVKLSDMTDRFGRELTLEQLRALESVV
jgi:SPP1 gp7 family putative phage head morphogenesis protein